MADPKLHPHGVNSTELDATLAPLLARVESMERLFAEDRLLLLARIEALEARVLPDGWVAAHLIYQPRTTVVANIRSGGVWSISNGSGDQAQGKTLAEAIAALPEGVLAGLPPRAARFG